MYLYIDASILFQVFLFPSLICIAIIRFCSTLLVVETQPIRWRKKQIAERVEEKQPHIHPDRCWRYLWDVCRLVEESGGTRRCGGSPGSLGRAASSGCQWRDSNANRPVGTKVAVETLGLMTSCLHNGTSTFISSLAKCRRRSRRRGGPIHPNIKTHTNGLRIVDVHLEIAFDFYVSTITVANRSDGCWFFFTDFNKIVCRSDADGFCGAAVCKRSSGFLYLQYIRAQ